MHQPGADATNAERYDTGGDPPCWAHLKPEADPVDDSALAKLLHDLADAVIIADPGGDIVY